MNGYLLAIWIRESDTGIDKARLPALPLPVRIEFIREQNEFWRMLVLSGFLGFAWLIPNIMTVLERSISKFSSNPADQSIIQEVFNFHIWVYIIVAVICPFREGVAKISRISKTLLDLRA